MADREKRCGEEENHACSFFCLGGWAARNGDVVDQPKTTRAGRFWLLLVGRLLIVFDF
jgi:hypothetical protein